MSNQSFSWLAFVAHNALSRTAIHFFPFSGLVTAPYATECRLTIFSAGGVRRTVTLDGARLGQPDGLRVEDAFPEVAAQGDGGGFVGLQIDLESSHQRVDLSGSGCIIEFTRPGGGPATRFRPSRIDPVSEGPQALAPLVGLKDRFQTTSVVVVNAGEAPFAAEIRVRPSAAQPWDGAVELTTLDARTVPPGSVEEIELDARVWDEATVQECGWGACATRALDLAPPPAGVAYFALYRDAEQRRPVSVIAMGERQQGGPAAMRI